MMQERAKQTPPHFVHHLTPTTRPLKIGVIIHAGAVESLLPLGRMSFLTIRV